MKTLNDHFTKLFVINLDRRRDRYNKVVTEFKKINARVDRISGIDGKVLPNSKKLTPRDGACLGLTTTHYNIIKEAKSKGYENILTFEDDVTFVNDFNRIFNEKIEFLPDDWDLLYLGGNHILGIDGFNLITGDKDFKVNKENYKTLNYELSTTPNTWCAHAVAINSKFYDQVLTQIEKSPVDCIDVAFYHLQQGGCNTYTFLPSLATQGASFSDIENANVDYDKMPQVNF